MVESEIFCNFASLKGERRMRFLDGIYRSWAWIAHCLTAKATQGNGVHSPHLFYLVRMLFYDKNAYYCFRDIESQRARLLRNKRRIYVKDYGSGTEGLRKVAKIAQTSLASKREGQLLFRLVECLKPQKVLELGTSLGITTAYLAHGTTGQITTLEGSEEIQKIAKDTVSRLKLQNVDFVLGNIDETLKCVLEEMKHVDFAFIDANHTEEATIRYFEQIMAYCGEKSVIVLDDIYYSREMTRAWKTIQTDPRVTTTMDLYQVGIVFLDKQYLRKNYKITVF